MTESAVQAFAVRPHVRVAAPIQPRTPLLFAIDRQPVKLAIVGSRPEVKFRGDSRQPEYFERDGRDAARRGAIFRFVSTLPGDIVIVSGGAPGADTWADEAAQLYGFPRDILHAAWKRCDGRKDLGAGKARNARIAAHADRVVAFIGASKSGGTAHCVECFRALGKPAEIRDWRGDLLTEAEYAAIQKGWR